MRPGRRQESLAPGVVDCELSGMLPVAQPVWLSTALVFGDPAANKLVGMNILYQFGMGSGGWALGEVTRVNKDPKVTMEVESSDGVHGVLPANFYVHYAIDEQTLPHKFDLDDYALSNASDECSWVLVVTPPPPKRKRLLLPPATDRIAPLPRLMDADSGAAKRVSPRLLLTGPLAI